MHNWLFRFRRLAAGQSNDPTHAYYYASFHVRNSERDLELTLKRGGIVAAYFVESHQVILHTFWSSSVSFEASRGYLEGWFGPVLSTGRVGSLELPKALRRPRLSVVLLSAAAVLGALEVIGNRFAWLLEYPDFTVAVSPRTLNMIVNKSASATIAIENYGSQPLVVESTDAFISDNACANRIKELSVERPNRIAPQGRVELPVIVPDGLASVQRDSFVPNEYTLCVAVTAASGKIQRSSVQNARATTRLWLTGVGSSPVFVMDDPPNINLTIYAAELDAGIVECDLIIPNSPGMLEVKPLIYAGGRKTAPTFWEKDVDETTRVLRWTTEVSGGTFQEIPTKIKVLSSQSTLTNLASASVECASKPHLPRSGL